MFAGTLALLNHSLQLDARLLRHHLYRLAFVGILYLFILAVTAQRVLVGAPGQWLFGWISDLNFWFITLAGISYFATAISEEKEEETLGILRMAGIGPTALLLGKSTSRLIIAGLLLALQFPFTLLSITLGGVTGLQLVAVFLALLAYAAFVANLALFCSVMARTSSRASLAMTVLLALFFFVPPLARSISGSLGSGLAPISRAIDAALAPEYETSPLSRLSQIMRTGFDESPFSFQVMSNFAAAILLFVLSRILFDRVTRYHSVPSTSRGLLIRPKGRLKFLGTGRVWQQPLLWKEFHFITGGKPLMLLKSLAYALVLALVAVLAWIENPSNPWYAIAFWTIGLSSLVLLIEATLSAASVFRDEVQLNSLSTLMLLPTTPNRIAYAKVGGCLLGLIPATCCLLLGIACFVPGMLLDPDAVTSVFTGILLVIGGGAGICCALFFIHLVAYLSLVVKWGGIPLAIGITLAITVFFCWIYGANVPIYLGGAVLLHFLIGNRLRQLATDS